MFTHQGCVVKRGRRTEEKERERERATSLAEIAFTDALPVQRDEDHVLHSPACSFSPFVSLHCV